jgi:hypothetical protein
LSFTSTALNILIVEVSSRPAHPPRRLFHDRSRPLDQSFSVAEPLALQRNRTQPCAYGDCGARCCELVDRHCETGRDVERVRCAACARAWTRVWVEGEGA